MARPRASRSQEMELLTPLGYKPLRLLIALTFIIGVSGIAVWLAVMPVDTAHSISGNIRDSVTDVVVENVQVVVVDHPEHAMSLPSGNYTLNFHKLPPEGTTLTLYFSKDGYSISHLQAQLGDTKADAKLVLVPLNTNKQF